jgi:hypothetical protein
MNERIRELAIEAGYMEDGFGIGHWDMPECKKFAELIIKECAKSCGSQVDKVSILKAFGLPVEDNIKYPATPPKWSKESQYQRDYNMVKETK